MFQWLGRQTYRFRWPIIAAWILLFVVAIPALLRVEEPLKVGGFSSSQTESAKTTAIIQEHLGFSPSTMVIVYQSATLSATDPAFLAQVRASVAGVRNLSQVTDVILPEDDPSLISADGTTAYALVGLDLPPEEAQRDVPAIEGALRVPRDLTMLVAGGPAFYRDIETVSQRDLRRAELIAFPFALVALLLVFGSVVAAMIPLIVGGLGVAGVLLSIYGIAHVADISIFALNLATMLGLGLAVDYSLFVSSRFREELHRNGGDVGSAVGGAIGTAGRAVFFSGLTVLIGLSGLALFDFMFLRSVGIAGVLVVFWSVLAALTLLPAVLGVVGTRIDLLPIRRSTADLSGAGGTFWIRLSNWVMAHPWRVLVPTLAFLVLLGLPFLHVQISSPDATILPDDLPSRQAFDVLVDEYGAGEISPFVITLQDAEGIASPDHLGAIYDLTLALQQDPRVDRVQGIGAFDVPVSREQAIALMQVRYAAANAGLDPLASRLISDDTAAILVYSKTYANSPENKDLLAEIRSGSDDVPGLSVSVGGGTAEIVDVVDRIYTQFPKAVVLIVIATYLVLLVLFRALLLPLKAILMNALSIFASYGALVFIFQDGHFSRLLQFDRQGYVEASLPVIMFCVLFGLSMDYEVFLLSRIREEWDRTHDNTASVALGLQRSGKIITSAALIVVVVTASFVSADVILIKALGLGIALAVFLDATIVRALLVPATMRLLGDWNWWLPGFLDRILPRGFNLDEE